MGLVQGLSDETLCNLLGCIQAEQYRFRLVHLRTIIVYMAKKKLIRTEGQTDQRTDGQTGRWTDWGTVRPSYSIAMSRLKTLMVKETNGIEYFCRWSSTRSNSQSEHYDFRNGPITAEIHRATSRELRIYRSKWRFVTENPIISNRPPLARFL